MRKIRATLTIVPVLAWASFAAAGQQSSPLPVPVAQLTLKSAVELAVRNSRDLTLAKLQAELADKTAWVDRSAFLPNLSTGTGAEYSSGFPLAPGGGVPALFALAYSQQVYNPLAKGQYLADRERARAMTAGLDSVRDAVITRTATIYLDLTKVRHALEVLHKERLDSQKIVDLVRERVTAGFELSIEQTKAELNAARIEQRIAHEDGRDEELAGRLRDLLGLQQDQPLELVVEDLPPAAEEPLPDLVSKALASSVELRQAEAERTAKDDILKGTRGNRWPTVALVGNYSLLSNTNNFSQYFNKFTRNNVNVGVQVNIPIFNPRTSAAMSVAQADVSAAEVELRAKRSQVELQVRAQAHLLRELELGRDVARLDLKLSQQSLALVQAQNDQGRSTLRELEQAHLEENDKWLAFLEADFQRQQAQLALLQSTGQVSRILQ